MTTFFRRRRGNNNNNSNNHANNASASPPSSSGALPRSSNNNNGRIVNSRARSNPLTSSRTAPLICHTCRDPISRNTRHIHTSRNLSGERRYHRECFLCLHCNAPIDPQTQSFCYAKLTNDENNSNANDSAALGDDEHPFHRECFAKHFGWMCVVCEKPLPMVTNFNNASTDSGDDVVNNNNNNAAAVTPPPSGAKSTKVEFLKHPFFEKERMCPHHVGPIDAQIQRHVQQTERGQNRNNDDIDSPFGGGRNSMNTTTSEEVIGEIRRCAGCHRFEPLFASPTKHFIDVGDSNTGRCVCLACCRTVVTNSDDVAPLWDKVIDFFEGPLGLITSEESLFFPGGSNDRSADSLYGGPCTKKDKGGVTRRDLKNIPVVVVGMEALNDNMRRHSSNAHSGSSQIMTRGLCLSERCGGDHGNVGVTAILCLSGLPSDLTASILAHEATHAWIKLHPNFPYTDPLPLKVEEGLCQLVAHLFLNEGLEPVEFREYTHSNSTDDSGPTDEKLRQYFRFCIETDEGVYGEGFRLAARAYAKMGIQELLYYVAINHDFPPLL
mmetsp:Transcript_5841/g.12777  ORF Transcript_5841/g.12777 Transcript_5841/m.12777 type:complete len:552 (-) Transcript_5841:558-2213(-)